MRKNASIAVAVMAATLLAVASVQVAAEPRGAGGMAAGSAGGMAAGNAGGMAAGNKAGGPGVKPSGTRTNPKGKKYKAQTPPTHSQPYCPYGKKADGTCWERCRYTICL
jgi:hypothetical protein